MGRTIFQWKEPGLRWTTPPIRGRREPTRPWPSSKLFDWPTTRPTTLSCGRPRRRSWRNAAAAKSDAATVAITVEVVAPGVVAATAGVAAENLGVATLTTTAEATAVADAEEASGAGGGSGRRHGSSSGRGNRGGGSSRRGTGGRRDGERGRSNRYGSLSFSSTFSSSADHGEVTFVAGKRQATPSLVDVASSAERLSKRSVTGDRAKLVSSNLAHARTAAIATADAAADARHEATVHHEYVTLGLQDVARISALPFPDCIDKTAGAQQRTRSVKAVTSEILMRSDDRCTEGLRSPTWYQVGTSHSIKRSCMP